MHDRQAKNQKHSFLPYKPYAELALDRFRLESTSYPAAPIASISNYGCFDCYPASSSYDLHLHSHHHNNEMHTSILTAGHASFITTAWVLHGTEGCAVVSSLSTGIAGHAETQPATHGPICLVATLRPTTTVGACGACPSTFASNMHHSIHQ